MKITLTQYRLILSTLFFASCLTHAQPLSKDVTKKVDKVFEKWNRQDSPGCTLGVYQNGKIVYQHGYGIANLNDNVPNTPTTVFHVASISKQFTAASIVLLAQQGKLSLDDDVRKYIPELPQFGEKITIRNLIYHTSGLRDQWDLLALTGWRYSLDLITDDDVMSVVTHQKELNFKPGDKHIYSNTGYTLLGIIVKRVSGMSLREYTTQNIFKPLGMTHTHFRDDHAEIIKHNALGYTQTSKNKPIQMSLTNFDTVGATSLHTTVVDLQLWDENFYHPRIGGPQFIKQMLETGKLNNGDQLEYAFGLRVGKYKGLPILGHAGSDAGYRSDMTRFPDQHFSAAVLCNSAEAEPSALVRQVADIILINAFKQAGQGLAKGNSAAELTPQKMAVMEGTYWNKETDDIKKILVKNDQLQISFGVNKLYGLKSIGDAHFHIVDAYWGDRIIDFHFVDATRGRTRHLIKTIAEGKPVIYEAVAIVKPTVKELTEFAGVYVSEEIDPAYHITLQHGHLILTRLKQKAELLQPAMQDVFISDIGTLRFTRDEHHRISGFILNSDRIRNFRFTGHGENYHQNDASRVSVNKYKNVYAI